MKSIEIPLQLASLAHSNQRDDHRMVYLTAELVRKLKNRLQDIKQDVIRAWTGVRHCM